MDKLIAPNLCSKIKKLSKINDLEHQKEKQKKNKNIQKKIKESWIVDKKDIDSNNKLNEKQFNKEIGLLKKVLDDEQNLLSTGKKYNIKIKKLEEEINNDELLILKKKENLRNIKRNIKEVYFKQHKNILKKDRHN